MVVLVFFKVTLDILGFLNLHIHFKISLSVSAEKPSGIMVVVVLNLSQFEGELTSLQH